MISGFQGKYRFLSNFYPCPSGITLGAFVFRTVEHAYQAAKSMKYEDHKKIWECDTPGQAKKVGRKLTLRPDWDYKKLDMMLALVREKFANNRELRELLLATGEEELVEENYWKDTFWGVYEGRGHNHLGKILMKVRGELKDDSTRT